MLVDFSDPFFQGKVRFAGLTPNQNMQMQIAANHQSCAAACQIQMKHWMDLAEQFRLLPNDSLWYLLITVVACLEMNCIVAAAAAAAAAADASRGVKRKRDDEDEGEEEEAAA